MANVLDNKQMSPWKLLAGQHETLHPASLPEHPQFAQASSNMLPADHSTYFNEANRHRHARRISKSSVLPVLVL